MMATRPKTAYELSESQVETPPDVVTLFWELARARRPSLGPVLDLGAGDGRFNSGGHFRKYTGIEIDRRKILSAGILQRGVLIGGCAFKHNGRNYAACIGNPPYVRHHDIESPWKGKTVERLNREMGVELSQHCNLYLYFMCLGLLKSRPDGLLGLVIPYEWVSRPSAKAVREYIKEKGWSVDVYRFSYPIFSGVLTTASVTFVDKASQSGCWSYFDVDRDHKITPRVGVADSRRGVLDYARRGKIWAMRGLSPGSQQIFTLTEGQRVHYGLSKRDVTPCITAMRHLPREMPVLSAKTFREYYVDTGERCWLVNSHRSPLSSRLAAYLKCIPKNRRDTYTCRNQQPWYRFRPHPAPRLLVSSGFTSFGPKVLINSVKAIAVGSAFGVHGYDGFSVRRLRQFLMSLDFESRVVAHAKTLKKVEVGQLNSVLNAFAVEEQKRGKAPR
jgi:hypothetical protein